MSSHQRFLSCALIGATLLLAGSDVQARRCRSFAGDFSSVLVVGPPCTSPIGMCTHGQLTGGIVGTYDFTFQTLSPKPNDPSTQVYTGTSLITFKRGGAHVFGKDHGAMHFIGPTTARFLTIVDVVGGDRGYQHASGAIAAGGTLDLATGKAVGTYHGRLCRGGDDDDAGDDDDDDDDGDDDGDDGGDRGDAD